MDHLRRAVDALRSAFMRKAGFLRALALVGAVIVLTAATPAPAEACGITDPLSCVAMIFVKIFQLLTALMGWILVLEVEALIRVAQFFNFVSPGPTAVQIGWVVTRDLANMFFIVVLLIIAFGTILGSSTYHYSKNLPRLLIMAVVINFSKTICGIFIDMGQVVMLTFVNGFKETAAGNFMNAYQINKLLALGNTEGSYTFGMVIAMMFAFILAAIAVCVTLVLLVILLFRVVMLWILIILSPIAFLTSAIPRGGDYYAKWWGEFKKYIITGPIIAFFMWLALASVQQVGPGGFSSQGFPQSYAGAGEASAAAGRGESRIPTEAGTADTIMNMVIAICIMFAGLKYASESGVVGAGVARSVRGGLEKTGRAIATGGLKMAAQPVLTAGGRQLAKVPLVGGLGRAAVLQGEKWKKERRAKIEKFAGTPEDMARLSPSAFNRSLGTLATKASQGKLDGIDQQRLSKMMDIGLKDPDIAAGLGKSGIGHQALNSMVQGSKGKDLQAAVGTMMSDKNAKRWTKDDPDLLKNTYEKLNKEWKNPDGSIKDPNLGKTVSEFEQKFAPQLVNAGVMDRSKLREIVPKMSGEDLGDVTDAADMAMLAPHMLGSQLRKIMSDGKPKQMDALKEAFDPNRKDKDGNPAALMKPDAVEKLLTDKGVSASDLSADHMMGLFDNPTVAAFALKKSRGDAKARAELISNPERAQKLALASRSELVNASIDGDAAKITSALIDSISLGTITADEIKGGIKGADGKQVLSGDALQGMIANRMNTSDLAKNVNRSSSPQAIEAATAVMAQVMAANPEKAKNMRRQEMYQDILPTQAQIDAAGAEEKHAQAMEVDAAAARASAEAAAAQAKALEGFGDALGEAKKQLDALGNMPVAQNQPTAGSEAAYAQMERLIKNLESAGGRRDAALKEKSAVQDRIAKTSPSDTAALEGLKKALSSIDKNLQKTEQEIIKGMNALKGGGKA